MGTSFFSNQSGAQFSRSGLKTRTPAVRNIFIVQELCESRGGHPGLSVLMSLLVSVDIKRLYQGDDNMSTQSHSAGAV